VRAPAGRVSVPDPEAGERRKEVVTIPRNALAAALALLLPGPAAFASAHSADSAGVAAAAPDTLAARLLAADSTARALPAPAESLAGRSTPAPVYLGGREIFRVRSVRDGLTPASRAAAIRARLTQVVTTSTANDSVELVSHPDGVEVRAGDRFLWLITPGDLPERDPVAMAAALAELPNEIRDGIARERAARRPARVLVSAGIAVLLTLLAIGLARLLLAGSRRWRRWLKVSLGRRLPAVHVRSFEVLSRAQVRGLVTGLLGWIDILVGLLLLYGWLTAVFSLFPWTQGWSALLLAFAARQALHVLRNIASGVPGLFAIAIIVVVFRWLNAVSSRFFAAIGDGSLVLGHFHPELAAPSRRLVTLLLVMVAAIVAWPYVPGSGSRAVQGFSLFFGIVVSLGSTGIIGNMIAGIVLTYSRSFRVGDRVRIGDQVGDVVNLGFFATKLRSLRNEEVTIPNGHVAGAAIVNFTRMAAEHGLVLHTQVSIGYDAEWRRVHALLVEAAGNVAGIEREPRPWVLQVSLGDFYPTYELCCVTRESHAQQRLYSDLHAAIQDAFARAGIEILSPSVHAVRDANAPVLPAEPSGPREAPGGFRITPRD
jgi:small-conductance mechanosensitive channel